MNALFMLSYMLATLLYGQVAMAQEQVSFQLQLDPIVLVAGSESRDLEPRNIDALIKIKWEFAQAKKGYTHFGGSYELIDMPTDYHRFALEGGYTFNQLFDYLSWGFYADLGLSNYGAATDFTYGFGLDFNFRVHEHLNLVLSQQTTRDAMLQTFIGKFLIGVQVELAKL